MKTIFFRVLHDQDKAMALRRTIDWSYHGAALNRYEVDLGDFAAIPGSPFAYWVNARVRGLFRQLPAFGTEDRVALKGLTTTDDNRFVRNWFEVESLGLGRTWKSVTRGGPSSLAYRDLAAVVRWANEAEELWAYYFANAERTGGMLKNVGRYFEPGLTWPLRGVAFTAQVVPAGCVFSNAGKQAVAPPSELLAWLAVFNSRPFDYLVRVFAGKVGGVQYEVGLINGIAVPPLSSNDVKQLSELGRRSWSLMRSLDTVTETSHAFVLPAGLNEKVTGLDRDSIQRELHSLKGQIDKAAFGLYAINPDDCGDVETGAGRSLVGHGADSETQDEREQSTEDEGQLSFRSDGLISWLVGVAFGRFDPRLATGERAIPSEPGPFDPLPSRSPGMYPEGEEAADTPDILVDDKGHTDDLTARALAVAERVKVEVSQSLRGWFAREFFPLHIRMYSKSRRKAPIYWQLATPSAGYSVWLYIHAFSKDTFFRVQNDYVAPKLAHEERRLESLSDEVREGATAAQRKQLSAQEALVEEMRAFLDEVKRVAPLWKPNLDDGVIINFAPLWRLVPQNKAWQKELKSTWDALCEERYDWAHLAMHLWPERVIPKCAQDRSLAIAHGLEDVFWIEGTDGKWIARRTPTMSVDQLVKERTSPAVKSALKSLLEAPVASGKSTARKGRGRRKATAAAEGGDA
jgi:hypothetical protein